MRGCRIETDLDENMTLCDFLTILMIIMIGVVISAVILMFTILVSLSLKHLRSLFQYIDGEFGITSKDLEFLEAAVNKFHESP